MWLASELVAGVAFVVDVTAKAPIEQPEAAPGRALAEILAAFRALTTDAVVARNVYALAGRFTDRVSVDAACSAPGSRSGSSSPCSPGTSVQRRRCPSHHRAHEG